MPHQLTYQHNLPKLYKIGFIAYQEFLIFSLMLAIHPRVPNMQTNCAKKNRGGNLVTRMEKFGAGKIWYEFVNSMAKFGTILLCQNSPFQISPIPNPPPPPRTVFPGGFWMLATFACMNVHAKRAKIDT